MSEQKFQRGCRVKTTVDMRSGGVGVDVGAMGIVQGRAPVRDSDPDARYYTVRFGNDPNSYAVVYEGNLKHESELDEFISEVQ